MTPSCLQNQYHLGDSYTLPRPAAAEDPSVLEMPVPWDDHQEQQQKNTGFQEARMRVL